MNRFSFVAKKGPLLIMLAALLWAADGVLRRSLYTIPPLHIVFFEHLLGLLFLLPFLWRDRKHVRTFSRSQLLNLSVIAFFSSLLGTLWFTTALTKVQFISFSVVFLLQKLQPLFVIIAASIVLKERLTKEYLRFMAISVIAAFFVTFPNGMINFNTGSATIIAALYALGAAALWGTSTIFSKIALRTKPDVVVTGMRFLFATLFALIWILWSGTTVQLMEINGSQLLRFALIALSTGMVAMVIYYKGLALVEAKIATLLELLFPVTAVIIDAVVFKTTLVPSQYLAAMVLLFSAYRLGMLKSERQTIFAKKIAGKGRGKKLGVPTINFTIPTNLTIKEGIYAAYVTVNKKSYKAALHYGPVPAFKEKAKSLEAFILDNVSIPAVDLQAEKIKIEFIQYIRPVMNFSSPEKLVAQIELDIQTIQHIL